MNTYEIVYYDIKGPTTEETDTYAIFEVSEDKTQIRIYAQTVNGAQIIMNDSYRDWFDNTPIGVEKKISDEELFTLCL